MINEGIQTVFRNPIWEIRPKLQRYPTKRWGHTAILNKNKLYIYGGKTGKTKEPIYELDCDSFQSQIFDLNGFPDARESHSCSLVKEKIIIWGGCRLEKALNDCLTVTIKDQLCFWTPIVQFVAPKERQSHATVVLKDKYILLYGGSNEEHIYEDFWIYNSEQEIWLQIKSITGRMTKRLGCTLTGIKNKIYMFGGETQDQKYQNQIYRITLSQMQFNTKDKVPQMRCQLVPPITKNCPVGRTCHSALSYLDRYLIIIGGQGQGVDPKSKNPSMLLSDMWCFDTEENTWQLIQVPNQNIFRPRSCFSANLYRNKIYIFGGLMSLDSFKSSDQLIILSFSQPQQKTLDVCNLCKLHFKPTQTKPFQKQLPLYIPSKNYLNFGLNSLFKLSRTINNPFDAVCLIIEAFVKMKYRSMFLDLNQDRYILIRGSHVIIEKQNFLRIAFDYEFIQQIDMQDILVLQAIRNRIQQQNLQIFGFNIKNACARLGYSFAFINHRDMYIDMLLITPENIFYSEFNTKDNTVCKQHEKSFEIIKNFIDRNSINFQEIHNATFTIVISNLQQISYNRNQLSLNNRGLIQITGSTKRMNLQSYCSTMFLKKPPFNLSINNILVDFRDIQEEYAHYIYQSSVQHYFKTLRLKASQKQTRIYIYRRGIRVGKFIKNIQPNFKGYVEVPINYQLDILRHRIQNTKLIEGKLDDICSQLRQNGNKRKNPHSVHQLQQMSREV